MGVLPCHREDCDSIMCEYYVQGIGYICWECKGEFQDYIEKKFSEDLTEGQIEHELRAFMNTAKSAVTNKENIVSVDEFFNQFKRY